MTVIKLSYFNTGTTDEFACKCGKCGLGVKDMQPKLLRMLDVARFHAGVSFVLNRAISCPEHNSDPNVGGSETSSHLTGWAVDIDCNDAATRYHIIRGLILAGFTRIGVYKDSKGTFIHADCDPTKTPCVLW